MPDLSACVSDFPNSILYDLAEYHLRFLVIIHYLLHRTVRKKSPNPWLLSGFNVPPYRTRWGLRAEVQKHCIIII